MIQKGDAKQGDKTVVQVDAELEDIVPVFLENRYGDIKAISVALEQGDYETIRILGHTMKGIGGGYGFDAITDIGQSLEQAAQNKESEEVRKLIGELSTYLERVEVVYE